MVRNKSMVAYSKSLGKIIYINAEYSENKLGVIDIATDTNTLQEFPTGFTGDKNGLIPFENSFLMYNGDGNVIKIDGDLTYEELDYTPIRVLSTNNEMYEYRDDNMFVVELENLSEVMTPIQERVADILFFDRSTEKLFHRGRLKSDNSRGVFAYDPLIGESVKVTEMEFDRTDYYKNTNNGNVVISGGYEYLITASDEQNWQEVQHPDSF
jgi:hypothetical protein